MRLRALSSIKRTGQGLFQCLWIIVILPILLAKEAREERGSVYEGFSLCVLFLLVLPGYAGMIMAILHPYQFLAWLVNG
ncbi:MAG: hypothetical protein WC497_01325 [Patescibacteria group bacterium]